MDSAQAVGLIEAHTDEAIRRVNDFTNRVMRTRGGRIGAGMGTVLETLYGYFLNEVLGEQGAEGELGWLANNEYNDFAFLETSSTWEPSTKAGELLRLEIKAMVRDADESKAHFDEIQQNIGPDDLLIVLGWTWQNVDTVHVSPTVVQWFVGSALGVAQLRDRLHEARGGSFVMSGSCPDGCAPYCAHVGEPLNAARKRERKEGPASTKPANCGWAANFGGLVRMLKTQNDAARQALREVRATSTVAHRYISFVDRFLPDEEINRLTKAEWHDFALSLGLQPDRMPARRTVVLIRQQVPDYQDRLRAHFAA